MKSFLSKHGKVAAVLATAYLPVAGGFDFVFIDYISAYIDSVSLVFIRAAASSIMLLAVHLIKEGPLRIAREDRGRLFIGGGLGIGIYYILEAIGISMTSAALSSLILALVPVFGLIGDRMIFKNKITPMKLTGVIASVVGVAVIILGTSGSKISGSLTGIGILIIACIIWAAYVIIVKPLNEKYSMLTVTTALFISGTIVEIPIFLLYKPESVLGLSIGNWISIIAVAAVCITLGQLLYLIGVRRLSVTVSSIMMNLLPFVAIIVSWIVFREMLTPIQLTGGIIIIAGITFVALDGGRESGED